LYFLYDPPVNSKTPDGEFYNDWWYYEWGKTQREYSYAVWDEDAELMSEEELGVYNDVMGIEVGDKAPEIIQLARRAVNDVVRANKMAKNHFKRVRPFAFYGEPSIAPEKDEHLSQTWSYPSGHTARGWMFALVLASIAPERAEAIAVRANAFAMNRVICGHHWKSDIDAGKIEASVIFAAITGTPEYQEQLQKARAEYEKIAYPDEPASVPKTLSEKSKADGQIYDMQGRKLESLPAHAPYIHNGRKIMK
jgi:acid phosphatase (class A)